MVRRAKILSIFQSFQTRKKRILSFFFFFKHLDFSLQLRIDYFSICTDRVTFWMVSTLSFLTAQRGSPEMLTHSKQQTGSDAS